MNASDRSKSQGGKVDLAGGESAELHLTAPSRQGTYKLECSHFLHSSFGVTGVITVD
jgi:uncharacterized cupredoxin-like copper-binding protein